MTPSASGFDPLIHPLARLQLMAVLSDVTDIEFATLRDMLDLSDSLLSKHLSALGEAGYVQLTKAKANGRQRTWVAATPPGIKAFRGHLASLHALAAPGTLTMGEREA